MKLLELLKEIKPINIIGSTDVDIQSLCFDSRLVHANCVFFALPGTKTDGHAFISRAIESGASVIVCEKIPTVSFKGVTYIQVESAHYALGCMSSAFYDYPSRKLKLVGITGTNGKTTTATLLYNMFRKLGYKAGLFSTVEYYIDGKVLPATHTTPDALELNKLLNDMVEAGCEYCFMEVSSHSVVQNRIAGLKFAGAMFSNITHDHLDFHKTFDQYIKAKKLFFDNLSEDAFALVNKDDKNGMVMVQNTLAKVSTYALKTPSDFKAKIIENHIEGMLISLDGVQTWTKFLGEFNAYNLLCVYATAILLKQDKEKVLEILSTLRPVVGRFDTIRSKDGVLAIVDYAHTPNALENVLSSIRQLAPQAKIITIVGAGGDRDKTKRPIMASISYNNSDMLILTSDNPRTEDPKAILKDMIAGLTCEQQKQTIMITDRADAIRTACILAKPGDIILVAGKGHENYQEVNGVKHHFDDREELAQMLLN